MSEKIKPQISCLKLFDKIVINLHKYRHIAGEFWKNYEFERGHSHNSFTFSHCRPMMEILLNLKKRQAFQMENHSQGVKLSFEALFEELKPTVMETKRICEKGFLFY